MSHYILFQDTNKVGVPALINGVLAEKFDEKNPLPPMSGYSWTKTRDPNRVYPPELWLVVKDLEYNFDYIRFWDGFIVSKEFKTILDEHSHPDYKAVTLQVIGWKGKQVTDKKYFFIDIPVANWIDAIDYDESAFEWDKDVLKLTGNTEDGVTKSGKYFGMIKQFNQLVLKPPIPYQVFHLQTNIILDLIADETFKTHLSSELKTILYIKLPGLNDYNYRFRKDLSG